jgi:hypothetical protein
MLNEVLRGATFLDGVLPNWFIYIDEDTLELSSGCHCVGGQLGKHLRLDPIYRDNYFIPFTNLYAPEELPRSLDYVIDDNTDMGEWLHDHGFVILDNYDEYTYEELTTTWRKIIRGRLNGAAEKG